MDSWLAGNQFKPQTWLISGWFQYIIFSLQSCNSGSPILNCVPIRCTLLGLSGSSSTQIDITSRLDERFFSVSSQIAWGRDTERERGEGGSGKEGERERCLRVWEWESWRERPPWHMNDTFISLQTNNDRYLFIPTASVSITTDAQGNTFIQPNSNQDPNERMATVS